MEYFGEIMDIVVMMDTIFGGQNGEDCGNRLHGHDAELFGTNGSDGSFVVQLKQL